MPKPNRKRGRMLRVADPEWEPLLNFAPDHVADFMWMYAVELTDGTRLQAYKHCWTRDYLHLDAEGRTFIFVGKERYEEVNPALAADARAGDGAGSEPALFCQTECLA